MDEQEAHDAMREAFLRLENCERALERATKDEQAARELWEVTCRNWEMTVRENAGS